ncbi:hypothetical protein FRC12_021623 [Ceratobasidium sp. 428]|nr:hypothetical protein FRC12_021623 [Ceratobasidium sp. 428]
MSRFNAIPDDVQEFLEDYPDLGETRETDSPSAQQNLRFYSNAIKCHPDGLLIEDLLTEWQGNYKELEMRHGFIQWLFPIPEQGVNFYARPLTRFEIARINASPEMLTRVRRAYELMLDFCGMRLLDIETGLIGRKEDGWKARYQNLTRASHNNLRITRILKFLSIASHPHYAAPFVLHVLFEQSQHGLLNTPTLQNSLDKWWANCNRDTAEREAVQDIVRRVRAANRMPNGEDKWTFRRDMYEAAVAARAEGKGLVLPADS